MKRSLLRRKTPLRSKAPLERGPGPKRKTPLGPAPKAKREARFRRQYGSDEYVEWLHGFPCAVCGVSGWTEAAHTATGGTGMKAGPETLAPLCGDRLGVVGCHTRLDRYELEDHRFRLRQLAKRLRERFLATTREETP